MGNRGYAKNPVVKFIVFVLFPVLLFTAALKSDGDQLPQNGIVAMNSFFLDLVENKKIAGAVTLLIQEDRIKHLEAYGYLDVENAIPMNREVIFPIGSITKVITSIAVLQLVENGKLQLDDPVEKHIPSFASLTVLVDPLSTETDTLIVKPTIRDLMRHTSGLVYSGGKTITDQRYKEAGFREWNHPLSQFIEEITTIPLAYQPGTVWKYSYSHDILGYLIEVVSGTTLDNYFQENIFSLLALKDTGFYVPEEKRERMTNLYEYRDKQLYPEDLRESSIYCDLPEALSGGGGWWSSYGGLLTTLSDFCVLAEMLLNYGNYRGKQVLEKERIEELIKDHTGDLPEGNIHYGLGVGVKASSGETESIYWAGAPYNAYFQIDFKQRKIAVLFTNTAPFKHQRIIDTFIRFVEEEG